MPQEEAKVDEQPAEEESKGDAQPVQVAAAANDTDKAAENGVSGAGPG